MRPTSVMLDSLAQGFCHMCKTPAELLYRFVVLPAVANDQSELNVEEVPARPCDKDWSSVHSATELFVSSADERIHTKIESAYNLRKYGDIFELLDQEARVTDIRKKEKSLDELRTKLDALMTKDDDVDIEKSILKTDRDCFRAGELYKKLNLFASVVLSLEAKGFR
ncbi:hypothetical protein BV898_13506 [Hypsibius exemplaris]|uniref:Uncharacterized protein n=1 Tax=Hypsibius exemplaris TaxID=2072580 RepID=A0A1W0WAL1_HYPEX|nr:hypothetical protein BV898_13506 [Hypsibius exemplaris]